MKKSKKLRVSNSSKKNSPVVNPKAGQRPLRRFADVVSAESLEILRKLYSITTVEELAAAVHCNMGRPVEMTAVDWALLIGIINKYVPVSRIRPRRRFPRACGVLDPKDRVLPLDKEGKKFFAQVKVVRFDAKNRRIVLVD